MKITLNVSDSLAARLRVMFGDNLLEIAEKSLKRTLGEAELQKFAVAKKAEVEAEARRINEELALGGNQG